MNNNGSFWLFTTIGLINSNGRTPLGEAVHHRQLNVIEYFIDEHKVNLKGTITILANLLFIKLLCLWQAIQTNLRHLV